jgi:hypothetical protein
VAVSPGGQATSASVAAAKPPPLKGVLRLLCPPKTTHYCAGTITVRTTGKHPVNVASIKFKLAPGQLGLITFSLSSSALKLLRQHHSMSVQVTTTAHDGAKHPHKKTTHQQLTLTLAKPTRHK